MPQLMDPDAYAALALGGELEVTRDGSIPALAERVGYRVIQPGGPTASGVLATPQLADDPSLGGAAARPRAGAAAHDARGRRRRPWSGAGGPRARSSRPVADLRRSALALGRGQPMPPHAEPQPLEFEPVFGAFERMAADIRSSQHALEEARRRTSAVLATVATGVVGLDPGRPSADRQSAGGGAARHASSRRAQPLLDRLGPEWTGFTAAVRRFLADPEADGHRRARGQRPPDLAPARVAGPGRATASSSRSTM